MAADREFRVRWRREGMSPRSVIYQSRTPAERRSLLVQGRMAEATGSDPDDLACGFCTCVGGECGGQTFREAWERKGEGIPPLVEGPVLDVRAVGEWRPA